MSPRRCGKSHRYYGDHVTSLHSWGRHVTSLCPGSFIRHVTSLCPGLFIRLRTRPLTSCIFLISCNLSGTLPRFLNILNHFSCFSSTLFFSSYYYSYQVLKLDCRQLIHVYLNRSSIDELRGSVTVRSSMDDLRPRVPTPSSGTGWVTNFSA